MNVHLDARKIADFGIGTYIRGLLGGFAEIGAPRELTLFGGPEAATFAGRLPGWSHVAEPAPPYSVREQISLPRRLLGRLGPGALWHFPHYVTPLMLRGPMVVTVHDLTHVERPGDRHALAKPYALLFLSRALERAAIVITATDDARRRLERLVPTAAGRIRVIPHAVSPELLELASPRARETLRERVGVGPFLLYVGNDLPHKNLEGLLDAFALAAAHLPRDLRLVVAGPDPASRRPWTARLSTQALTGRVIAMGRVPADELRALYAEARLFVFPSCAEGFGLPPLEAMAQGTPVLATGIGAVREVLGGLATYAPDGSPEALAAALLQSLAPVPPDGARLRAHALGYSWRETARLTLDAYAAVLADA